MVIKLLFMTLLASSALSANIRYSDLEEEDQLLFRAAYDAPYQQEQYQEEEPPGKLDLLKDGMWALKSNMKQLKVFDKALAANLLATKLQVKELLGTLKKHHHIELDKKKPVYHYQSPAYHQYEAPHYPPATEHYTPSHAPPQYDPPTYASSAPPKYESPVHYEPQSYVPPPKYEPVTHYEPQSYAPPHKYEPQSYAPPQKYEPQSYAPPQKYEPQSYGPPQKYEPQSYVPPHKYEPAHQETQSYLPPSHKYEPSYQESQSSSSHKYEPAHYESHPHVGPKPTKYEPVVAQYPQIHIEGPQFVAPQPAPTYEHDPYYGY